MKSFLKKVCCILAAAVLILQIPVLPGVGQARSVQAEGVLYRVQVSKGYLALRSAKSYDYQNEIGKLYTDDIVEVIDSGDRQYWYVYSSKLGRYGYVNCDYLVYYGGSNTRLIYGVTVAKGYLALRSEMAYDPSNEIGKLYNGETVEVQDNSNSQYWYVYAPTLKKYGYVNCDYLYYISGGRIPDQGGVTNGSNAYEVSVSRGYLALRSSMAYDPSNEIGKLYNGDIVYVSDRTTSQYWYVYSVNLKKYGYVNCDYLVSLWNGNSSPSYPTRTVRVSKGYLALRSAKAYDPSNEIGRLYTGDIVEVRDSSDRQYWYVYAPTLGRYGYVNKDYLY